MTIFITGASRGIGLELTRGYLVRGAKVIATARNPIKAEKLSALQSEFPGQLEVLTLDTSSPASISGLKDQLKNQKPIDVLINNAGILNDGDREFETVRAEEILSAFQTNALGPLLVTRELLPWLKLSKKPIVANMTSLMGSIRDNSGGGYYAYRMSKTALNMFNKSFSVDHPEVISVVLHPGWVKTDMGGIQAPTRPEESAAGLIQVIDGLTRNSSGHFFDFQGKELPW